MARRPLTFSPRWLPWIAVIVVVASRGTEALAGQSSGASPRHVFVGAGAVLDRDNTPSPASVAAGFTAGLGVNLSPTLGVRLTVDRLRPHRRSFGSPEVTETSVYRYAAATAFGSWRTRPTQKTTLALLVGVGVQRIAGETMLRREFGAVTFEERPVTWWYPAAGVDLDLLAARRLSVGWDVRVLFFPTFTVSQKFHARSGITLRWHL